MRTKVEHFFHDWYYFWHVEWGKTLFRANDPHWYALVALAGETVLLGIVFQLWLFLGFGIEIPRYAGWVVVAIGAIWPYWVYGKRTDRIAMCEELKDSKKRYRLAAQIVAIGPYTLCMLTAFWMWKYF